MKTILLSLGILCAAQPARGKMSTYEGQAGLEMFFETMLSTIMPASPQWMVRKGTESYTLAEFMSAGKFCEWRGHIWQLGYHNYACMYCDQRYYICFICGRERKLLKPSAGEQWEP